MKRTSKKKTPPLSYDVLWNRIAMIQRVLLKLLRWGVLGTDYYNAYSEYLTETVLQLHSGEEFNTIEHRLNVLLDKLTKELDSEDKLEDMLLLIKDYQESVIQPIRTATEYKEDTF